MKRPLSTKPEVKMAGTGTQTIPGKAKKATGTVKHTIPKTASSGIKHQVILPKRAAVIASSSAQPSSPRHSKPNGNYSKNPSAAVSSSSSSSMVTMKTASRPGRVSKRNGVWYLGGNHVVKLLTSVDGDLDHSVLAKLAAVPTVVGELALSVESLVSDDVTVGGFEKDLLAKITSNTLTAKRGIMTATATPAITPAVQNKTNGQPAAVATGNTSAPPAQAGEGQVPNPLLANYQPVPNPLAIRITPPASPHANVTTEEKTKAAAPEARAEMPMIQAR